MELIYFHWIFNHSLICIIDIIIEYTKYFYCKSLIAIRNMTAVLGKSNIKYFFWHFCLKRCIRHFNICNYIRCCITGGLVSYFVWNFGSMLYIHNVFDFWKNIVMHFTKYYQRIMVKIEEKKGLMSISKFTKILIRQKNSWVRELWVI